MSAAPASGRARPRTGAPHARRRPGERGAALLIAMLVLTLVATVASAMVWHQQRAIEVEAAERARNQAGVMLVAILDTARFFIRTRPRNEPFVNGEGYSRKLEDFRLSQLLAVDSENNADSELEAFFSAQITDAQDRYNLRRLVDAEGKPVAVEIDALRRLCEAAGAGAAAADRLAEALAAVWSDAGTDGPLPPGRIEQLAWLGIDPDTVRLLAPHVTLLPTPTPVNANNASVPALMAAIDGLDAGTARVIVDRRAPAGLKNVDELKALLPEAVKIDAARVGVQTSHFNVRASVRLGDRSLAERWLVAISGGGRGGDVLVLQHERSALAGARP